MQIVENMIGAEQQLTGMYIDQTAQVPGADDQAQEREQSESEIKPVVGGHK